MNNSCFKQVVLWLSVALMLLSATTASALTFALPRGNNSVVGKVTTVSAHNGDTLADVGRRYDIGINEMRRANPGISLATRFNGGRSIVIPGQFILPPGPRKGIVINLAELRLYYFPADKDIVVTHPVGIGREGGWQTPIGTTHITVKVKDPAWRPTANVRAEAARNGTPIPDIFPAGPNNPLGQYAMRLGWKSYLMHGTNRPDGVGSRVSAGCIRMFPKDIESLYGLVDTGTSVRVINEPFKSGWQNGRLYFEAHRPLAEQQHVYAKDMASVVNAIHQQTAGQNAVVQWTLVKKAASHPDGVPVVIGVK